VWQEREEVLDRFEEAWRRGARPAVEDHLPTAPLRAHVLPELVQTDLEFRLKAGEAARVEEYLQRFPALAESAETVLGLLAAEFELRRRREPDLDPQEYGERFPRLRESVLARLGGTGRLSVPGYEILGELGRGGMGVVYKARQVALNRLVALKMVLGAVHTGPHERARFRGEAEAAAHLQHPNVVQVYEVGEQDGRPYLAMEYVAGGSLAQRAAEGPLDPRWAAGLVETLARAMHAAHQRGILHRDLKPANVLLAADGTPKITDFGLAKQMEEETRHSHSGVILGTPAYMAPEQATGDSRQIGAWTDVYALGAILYELLTGRPPFKAPTPLATLQQVVAEEPATPSALRPRLPTDLETICLKCLYKEPSRRYPSALELAEDLHHFRDGEPIRARPVGLWERARKWARRRPAKAALIGVAVAAVLALLGGAAWHTTRLREALADTEQARQAAQAHERQVRQYLYAADVRQAARFWKEGDVRQAHERLARHLPAPGAAEDVRDFAWHYLWRLTHASEPYNLFEERREVTRAAFSGGGQRVALASAGGTVTLRDLATGRVLATLPEHAGGVRALAYALDGRTVAVADAEGTVSLYDAANGQRRGAFGGGPKAATALAITGDLRLVASALPDRTVKLWGPAAKPQSPFQSPTAVALMAFSPDGRSLLVGGKEGMTRLWDVTSGRRSPNLVWGGFEPTALTFSRDGRAAAVGYANGGVTQWDPATGRATVLTGHASPVRALAFGPGGEALASAGDDTKVVWHDLSGRARGSTFKGHTDSVLAVGFAPDGKALLSAARSGTVKRWGPTGIPERQPVPVSFRPTGAVACAQDGTTLAVADRDGSVRLLDVDTLAPRATLRGHRGTVHGLAFGPGGRTLASGGQDGTVRLWDLVGGRQPLVLTGHQGEVLSVALSADGRWLASGGRGREVKVWDMAAGKERHTLRGHRGDITGLAFAPDGRTLASAGGDGLIKVWDPATARELASSAPGPGALALVFARDGRRFATGHSEGQVHVWETARCQLVGRCRLDPVAVNCLTWSADGKTVVTGSHHPQVCFWDVTTRSLRRAIRFTGVPLRSVSLLPDGKRVVTGQSGTVGLWDPATGSLRTPPGQPPRAVRALAFSPDGKTLITGSSERSAGDGVPAELPRVRTFLGKTINYDRAVGAEDDLRLWDVATQTERPRLPGQASLGILTLSRSADGHTLAAAGRGGAVWVWDLAGRQSSPPLFLSERARDLWRAWEASRRTTFGIYPEFREWVTGVALSPDGRLLAAVNQDGVVKLWDRSADRERGTLAGSRARASCLAFSPDGARLAVAEGNQVRVWDTADGTLRQTLSGHRDLIRCLAFSPDGAALATAGNDRGIRLWDLAGGRQRAALLGHWEPVTALAFSPDGRMLASASWDHTARLWHLASGQELFALEGHGGRVFALAFSPDGGVLATGGEAADGRGEVFLWQAAGR
jgi:WD40 repeat protein